MSATCCGIWTRWPASRRGLNGALRGRPEGGSVTAALKGDNSLLRVKREGSERRRRALSGRPRRRPSVRFTDSPRYSRSAVGSAHWDGVEGVVFGQWPEARKWGGNCLEGWRVSRDNSSPIRKEMYCENAVEHLGRRASCGGGRQ